MGGHRSEKWNNDDQEKFSKTFHVPKTQAGTNRVIHLIKPAIDALRSQMTLTRLSKEHIIDVHLREYGRTEKQKCTFVFQPEVSARVKNYGDHFTVDSIRQMWDAAIKRAGLRHRKSYQSRHTYACWSLTAGANPAFIANRCWFHLWRIRINT